MLTHLVPAFKLYDSKHLVVQSKSAWTTDGGTGEKGT